MICTGRWDRDVNWFGSLAVGGGGDDEQLKRNGSRGGGKWTLFKSRHCGRSRHKAKNRWRKPSLSQITRIPCLGFMHPGELWKGSGKSCTRLGSTRYRQGLGGGGVSTGPRGGN